jgi:hypothetical protein
MTLFVLVPWRLDWLWGILLIVVTVVFHAYILGQLNRGVISLLKRTHQDGRTHWISEFIIGGSALCATCLHGLEAGVWAIAYCLLGALGDPKGAMLYSISVMTTVGGSNLRLESSWMLMGPLEALNGWILFGLTTAFLFAVVQQVWAQKHLYQGGER